MFHITAVAKMPRLCVESPLTLTCRGHYYLIVGFIYYFPTADVRQRDEYITKSVESGTLVLVVSLSSKGSY